MDDTEWGETLENHCNAVAGADREKILRAARSVDRAGPWEARYGNGDSRGSDREGASGSRCERQ
jgi:hypothetical protein